MSVAGDDQREDVGLQAPRLAHHGHTVVLGHVHVSDEQIDRL
jgi:hypothetical protein